MRCYDGNIISALSAVFPEIKFDHSKFNLPAPQMQRMFFHDIIINKILII